VTSSLVMSGINRLLLCEISFQRLQCPFRFISFEPIILTRSVALSRRICPSAESNEMPRRLRSFISGVEARAVR